MAISLYRAGNTHTINGIKCEVLHCAADDLSACLGDGWLVNVEDIANGVRKTPQEAEEKPEAQAEKVLNPLRQKAKDLGIEQYDIKRFKTLESEINGLQN